MQAIGRVCVHIGRWAIGRTTSRLVDSADVDVAHLLRLDETSLEGLIGRLTFPSQRLSDRQAIERGQATLTRLWPAIRADLCPRRDKIESFVNGPELALAGVIIQLLSATPAVAVANPVAVLIVKRGLGQICRNWSNQSTPVDLTRL